MLKQRPRTVITTILAPAIVLLSCFGGLLLGRRTFLFRDSSHYYYPLWQWLAGHWQRGEFPLWNPYENAGAPLAADATASLFYPGKLLFLLPLPFDVAYNLFLAAHFVLAFWLTLRAARQFGLATPGASLAALSYTFSGSVLIQHANAPYLIGAAWLPLALSASYGLLRERSWRQALGLALALAMMILGGDVQAAYHMLLVLLLAWWFVPAQTAIEPLDPPRWFERRIVLVVASCGLAGGLAAIQILPARDWTAQSVRASYDQPRNVYEAIDVLSRDDPDGMPANRWSSAAQGIFGVPPDGSHQLASYDFSVGPWRWPEMLWPNVSGRLYPINRRWLGVIPAEGRVWAPSLYLGVVPLLLACSVLRLRRGRSAWRLLSWLAILSMVAALGWYGLGWIVHEIDYARRGSLEGGPSIGPQVGGLYWLFSSVLPGYAYFRYPAKWFVLATLALSLLAGHGLQVNLRRFTWQARRWLLGSLVLSFVALLALVVLRQSWLEGVSGVEADRYFGPLDARGAWRDSLGAIVHSLVAVCLGMGLFRYRQALSVSRAARLIVLLTAADLALAQHWLTPTAPVSLWQQESSLVSRLPRRTEPNTTRIFRSHSPQLLPPSWRVQSSPARMREGLAWERDTLHPKHYLASGTGSLDVSSAMISVDHAIYLGLVQQQAAEGQGRADFGELAVTHLLVPRADPRGTAVGGNGEQQNGESTILQLDEYPHLLLVENQQALPRVRLVRGVARLPELTDRSAGEIQQRTREVMRLLKGSPEVVLETNDTRQDAWFDQRAPRAIDNEEHAEIVREEPNRITLQVELAEPAVLVLADTFTPDWRAGLVTETDRRPADIWRANRLFRGVALPAGEYQVELAYQPASLRWGAWISGFSWLLLSLLALSPRGSWLAGGRREVGW